MMFGKERRFIVKLADQLPKLINDDQNSEDFKSNIVLSDGTGQRPHMSSNRSIYSSATLPQP